MRKQAIKTYNEEVLMYHLVCEVKYRLGVLTEEVISTIVNVCLEITDKYGIKFIEIGTDINHIHYLLQAPPKYSPNEIVTIIKNKTAKMVFKINPDVKKKLWKREFWSDGYYMETISQNMAEMKVIEYVKNQGNNKYKAVHKKEDVKLIW